MTKIVIIESDCLHAYAIKQAIETACKGEFHFTTFFYESSFLDSFDLLANDPPDLVITEQMVAYVADSDERKCPTNLHFFQAGSRCHDLLKSDQRTANVPVIFFTSLENKLVPAGSSHVRKFSARDGGLCELTMLVGEILHL